MDLTKILQNAPKGLKLYSTLYGEVELIRVDNYKDDMDYPIITCKNGRSQSFTKDGKVHHYYDGECVLFPSKDQRDWNKFTAPWYNEDMKEARDKIKPDADIANSVGPKFHEGEWVVFIASKSVYQVEKIENYEYTLRHILGGSMPLSFSGEGLIRKWTFEDAKDGDVLATSAGAFIYNGNNGGGSCPGSYCGINTLGSFQTGVEHHWTGKKVYPATKEQRDLLFTKIKEAGYEWDFNKKELKKIEDEKPQDVTERVKTFEDALDELKVRAANGDNKAKMLYDDWNNARTDSDDLIAYLKLRIITAVLNEGWEPKFDNYEFRYYPWFCIYCKFELVKVYEDEKNGLSVPLRSSNNAKANYGLVCAGAHNAYSYSYSFASYGFRLALKTSELAIYAGRQFTEEWADFMFKPRTGEELKRKAASVEPKSEAAKTTIDFNNKEDE